MSTSEIRDGEASQYKKRISLADALFSGTRQTLLRLFFTDPDRSYTLSQLIDLAQAGRGAVQRETARLAEVGLITQEGQSRGRLYRANPNAPIFNELCSLTRKVLGPAEPLRTALAPVSDQIDLALLYGSIAQGRDHAGSDIDVLIVSDELLLENIFEALSETEQALGRSINPTLYTKDEFRRRREQKSPFLTEVLDNKHDVLLGSLD